MQVKKRNGSVEKFEEAKIREAVYKCFYNGAGLSSVVSGDIAEDITQMVLNVLRHKGSPTTVEEIQDTVEKMLMAAGEFEAAKLYILYRDKRSRVRPILPLDPEERRLLDEDKAVLKNPIQLFQHYSKYARWDDIAGRRESWSETVNRVMTFLYEEVGGEKLADQEWLDLRRAVWATDAMPSMRMMQMAGPAAKRCHVCIYNCSYIAIDSITSLSELLYILMQGTGVGYSVEVDYVDKLPRVKKQKKVDPHYFSVPDNTDGWCDAFKFGMERWFDGEDIIFDYSQIREQGARLKTKGGRASGPDPLKALLDFTRERILSKQGERLSTDDVHDIACMAGQIVQVGGVRRAAEISISDLDDLTMRNAKKGQFWLQHPYRSMANNSAAYNEKPSSLDFMREWMALAESGTGERGIFNRAGIIRQKPKRRKSAQFGTNPCGEIVLRPDQFCNLSIAVAREEDTEETLIEKVRIASIFGTLQSTLTNFNYLSPDWKKNCEEERLLGVDITGQMDCPLLRPGAPGRELLLEKLRDVAIKTNEEYAAKLGINPSLAVTCVKPSGNSAQLLDCSSGLHPRYAAYYIRRCRAGAYDPISKMLQDAGVPCYPEVGQTKDNCSVVVFEFPVKAPEGAITRNDMTAIEQLDNWMAWKKHYTEHNPSITVYVGEDEWLDVCHWVYSNWEWVGGISFLPKSGGVYQLAPYEEITKEEYDKRAGSFPEIDWSKLRSYEQDDHTTSAQEYACVGGSCEI